MRFTDPHYVPCRQTAPYTPVPRLHHHPFGFLRDLPPAVCLLHNHNHHTPPQSCRDPTHPVVATLSHRYLTVTTLYPPAQRATQTILFLQTRPSRTRSAGCHHGSRLNSHSQTRLVRVPKASVPPQTKTVTQTHPQHPSPSFKKALVMRHSTSCRNFQQVQREDAVEEQAPRSLPTHRKLRDCWAVEVAQSTWRNTAAERTAA